MSKLRQQVRQYTAYFELNETGGYTVTIPALPGLVTEGRNLLEARAMAEDAIRCYVEGLQKSQEKIPQEREIALMRLSVTV